MYDLLLKIIKIQSISCVSFLYIKIASVESTIFSVLIYGTFIIFIQIYIIILYFI